MNNDIKTTAIGVALGAVQASQVDFNQVVAGNKAEIIKLITAVGFALLGYFSNKHPQVPTPPKS